MRLLPHSPTGLLFFFLGASLCSALSTGTGTGTTQQAENSPNGLTPKDIAKLPFAERLHYNQMRKASQKESKDYDFYLTDRLKIIQVIGQHPGRPMYGLSAIRNMATNEYYAGFFDNADGVKSISGYVLRFVPDNGTVKLRVQYWRNNLPLYEYPAHAIQSNTSELANAVKKAISQGLNDVPLFYFARLVKTQALAFQNLLAPQNPYRFPSKAATSQGERAVMETADKYLEGDSIKDGMIHNGLGFIINKTDGTATVGMYAAGHCEYSHVFSLTENHKYYKKDLCSGPASLVTLHALSDAVRSLGGGLVPRAGGFIRFAYSYCPDKIALCRKLLQVKSQNQTVDYSWMHLQCKGEFSLGVPNGLCVCKNQNSGVISAGIYVLGHKADPMVSIDSKKTWSAKNIAKFEKYRNNKLRELLAKYDAEHQFMDDLRKWVSQLIHNQESN
jgi:hypothetical protein